MSLAAGWRSWRQAAPDTQLAERGHGGMQGQMGQTSTFTERFPVAIFARDAERNHLVVRAHK